MRRVGRLKVRLDSVGGGGSAGVEGTGSGFDAGGALFRGVRRGSLDESSDCLLIVRTWSSPGDVSIEEGMIGVVLVWTRCDVF